MPLRRLALAAVCATALAGCGGGDDDGERRETAAALRVYFQQIKPVRISVRDATVAAGDALQQLGPTPDARWTRAAARVRTARATLAAAAEDIDAIDAPPRLGRAHARFGQAVDVMRRLFGRLLPPLERRDPRALERAAPSVTPALGRARTLGERWRAAVFASARRTGVSVPAWILREDEPAA